MDNRIYFGYTITYTDRATHYRALREKILRYTPKRWCSDDTLSRRANIFIIKNVNDIYNLGYDKVLKNKDIDRCYVVLNRLDNDVEIKLVDENSLISSLDDMNKRSE